MPARAKSSAPKGAVAKRAAVKRKAPKKRSKPGGEARGNSRTPPAHARKRAFGVVYTPPPRGGEEERHCISLLVKNEPGVLARVVGLFAGRGYNIESLTVTEVHVKKHLSRINIVAHGTPRVLNQIRAQLERLVSTVSVSDLTVAGPLVERELALLRVLGRNATRLESLRIADMFRARVVDSGHEHLVFEVSGNSAKVDAFIRLMEPLGLSEISRTGVVALNRGADL